MRKLTILALVALMAIAGSAFGGGRSFDLNPNATFSGGNPTTTNNDDSCDIGVAPAATLLLPYFEVSLSDSGLGENTLFTITNVSRLPQIAHVTVWTDWSFPILDFNIFLTGYDIQSISMWDVIFRGVVAPNNGTSSTNTTISPRAPQGSVAGAAPAANTANPNLNNAVITGTGSTSCSVLPGQLPLGLVAAVQTALTTGFYNAGAVNCLDTQVGGTHTNAIGYVTIDVAAVCSTNLPDNPAYIATEILFDNVLIGDYQQVSSTNNFAQGNPLVHIRAIPEGGVAGSQPGTNLPYTFYDRYTDNVNPRRDRRQPLPALFAARWIEGGTGNFESSFKIWREGFSVGTQGCADAADNSAIPIADVIRFDERENSFGFGGSTNCSPCGPGQGPELPETSRTRTNVNPPFPSQGTDIAGWFYLNLNNGGSDDYSALGVRGLFPSPFAPAISLTDVRASQNWVIVSLRAQGRFSVDFDAAWLGNGCSAAAADPVSTTDPVGPAGGVLVCPTNGGCTAGVAPYTGTNVTP